MPDISLDVPHALTQDEALARIKARTDESGWGLGDRFDNQAMTWDGPVGTFSASGLGMDISGTLDVRPHDVTVRLSLPPLAAVFQPQIEQGVATGLAKLLA